MYSLVRIKFNSSIVALTFPSISQDILKVSKHACISLMNCYQRNAKKFEFFKICWFLGPFLKRQCFGKMGMAGIKLGSHSSTIPSFLVIFNEEALLKVLFKNIDWFQICPFSKTTAFSKKSPEKHQSLIN